MTPDPETREAVDRLAAKVADLDADVRVVKHTMANMQQSSQGLAAKLEKIEDRMGLKLDGLATTVDTKIESLRKDLAAINVKQERGAGFFAGIAFVVVSCATLIMGLAKLLFGSN